LLMMKIQRTNFLGIKNNEEKMIIWVT
jgi:hypothetical protein